MKLISVIVPAYNVASYLPRCLDSILAQTYKNLEIILVDDGSSDETPLICDEYAKKDNRIIVIHQKNSGVSVARNAALNIAKGDYIGCVDSDDFIEPNMYEIMLNACVEHDAPLASCAYVQIGKGALEWNFTNEVKLLDQNELLKAYISDGDEYRINHSVWSKLIRKDLIGELRFPAGKNSEDISFTGNILSKADKCVYIDMPLYNYIVDRDDSIMNIKTEFGKRRLEEEIPFLNKQIDLYNELGLNEIADFALYHLCKRKLSYFYDFKVRKMKAAANEISKSIKADKNNINRVYEGENIKTGDCVRMKLFLFSPNLYYFIVYLYEKIIIPIREK